jgi:LmbE family N-acetylglucosaminyl deacetylase
LSARVRRVARRLGGRGDAAGAAAAQSAIPQLQPRLKFDPDAPELLLSPHWDDAVLSCWGVLTQARELNVVNVFAALPAPGHRGSWELVAGLEDSRARARVRIDEDSLALSLAGRRPRNLPLPEARHARASSRPDAGDIDAALTGELPAASRVYVPAGIGGHSDHLLTRLYGRALCAAGFPVAAYAEFPYCIFHGWPAWVDGSEPDPARDAERYWQSFLSGLPELVTLREGEVTRLPADSAQRKLEAIGCYRLSLNHAVRRMLADEDFHGIEVRWELAAAPGNGR